MLNGCKSPQMKKSTNNYYRFSADFIFCSVSWIFLLKTTHTFLSSFNLFEWFIEWDESKTRLKFDWFRLYLLLIMLNSNSRNIIQFNCFDSSFERMRKCVYSSRYVCVLPASNLQPVSIHLKSTASHFLFIQYE